LSSAVLSYKLIKKIKDEKFDVDNLHQYTLLLHLGTRDLQVGIVDNNDRMLFFEDYIFQNLNSNEDQLRLLQDLFEAHHLLSAGFWQKVVFSIKNNKFVQVPESLFIEEAAVEYLQTNAKFNSEKETVLYCRNQLNKAVTVFTIGNNLKEWVIGLYPNSQVKFIHQSTCLIEGILNFSSRVDQPSLYIYIDRFKLHVISAKDGLLHYYNQFPIQQFSDYVRYIMLVLNAMKMQQEKSQIILWGYIGKNSPHSIEFSKYIKNVTFGSRPDYLKFGYLFDELQDHHFMDLYAMQLLSH